MVAWLARTSFVRFVVAPLLSGEPETRTSAWSCERHLAVPRMRTLRASRLEEPSPTNEPYSDVLCRRDRHRPTGSMTGWQLTPRPRERPRWLTCLDQDCPAAPPVKGTKGTIQNAFGRVGTRSGCREGASIRELVCAHFEAVAPFRFIATIQRVSDRMASFQLAPTMISNLATGHQQGARYVRPTSASRLLDTSTRVSIVSSPRRAREEDLAFHDALSASAGRSFR